MSEPFFGVQDPLYVALIKELARSEIYDKKHGHLTQSISSFLKQEVDGRRYEDIVLSSCGYLNTSREKEARVTLSKYSHSLRKRISGGKKTYKTARGETRTVTTKGITFKAIYSETFPDNADPCNILAQTGNFSIDLSDGNQREESITSDCENDPPSCNDQHFPCGSRVHLLSPMHRSDEGQYIVYKVAEGISMCTFVVVVWKISICLSREISSCVQVLVGSCAIVMNMSGLKSQISRQILGMQTIEEPYQYLS